MDALRQITTNNVCIVHRLMFIALVFFFVKYASENFQILEGVNSKFFLKRPGTAMPADRPWGETNHAGDNR